MSKLFVGQVVRYVGRPDENYNGGRVHPAIVTRVWDEEKVNLRVFPDNAEIEVQTLNGMTTIPLTLNKTSVHLANPDFPAPSGTFTIIYPGSPEPEIE